MTLYYKYTNFEVQYQLINENWRMYRHKGVAGTSDRSAQFDPVGNFELQKLIHGIGKLDDIDWYLEIEAKKECLELQTLFIELLFFQIGLDCDIDIAASPGIVDTTAEKEYVDITETFLRSMEEDILHLV